MINAQIFQRKISYRNTLHFWNQSTSSKFINVMNKVIAVEICVFETFLNFCKCLSNYVIYPIASKFQVLHERVSVEEDILPQAIKENKEKVLKKEQVKNFINDWGVASLITVSVRFAISWLDQQFSVEEQSTAAEASFLKRKISSLVKKLLIWQSTTVLNQYGCSSIPNISLKTLCRMSSLTLVTKTFDVDEIAKIQIGLSLLQLVYLQSGTITLIAKRYSQRTSSMKERIQQMRRHLPHRSHEIVIV